MSLSLLFICTYKISNAKAGLFTSVLFPANFQNKLFSLESDAKRSGGKILGKRFLSDVEASDVTLRRKLDKNRQKCVTHTIFLHTIL